MRFFADNQIIDKTITVSTENAYYPKENLYNIHLYKKFKFTAKTSQTIKVDFGSAIDIDSFAINSNLTSSATINVQLNSSDSWGAPPVNESITTTGNSNIVACFTSVSYRYARVVISDATNSDDLAIGQLFLGEFTQSPGIKSNYKTSFSSTSTLNIGEAGQGYGKKGYIYKTHSFELGQYNATKKAELDTFYNYVDKVIPFFMVINYNNMTVLDPEYCVLNGWSEEKEERGNYFIGQISTRETF